MVIRVLFYAHTHTRYRKSVKTYCLLQDHVVFSSIVILLYFSSIMDD